MPNKFTTRIESQTKAELERQARERKLKKRAAEPADKQEQESAPSETSGRQTPAPQRDITPPPPEDTPESQPDAQELPDEQNHQTQPGEPAEASAVETAAPPEPSHEPDTPQPQQRARAKAPRQKNAPINPELLQGFVIQDEGRRAKNKTFYLDEQVIDAIKQAAADKNVTESRLVNDIFRQLLGLR